MESAAQEQRWRWTAFLACLSLVMVFGCGRGEEAPAEIRIGFLADMPTPIAESTIKAARLAVQAVNDAGGIDVDGRRHSVTMLMEDTGNTPEGTTRATLKLINQDRVAAIIGSSFSRNAIPSSEVAERAGVPMICPGSTHPQTTAGKRYIFRVSFIDSFQGGVMARFAREDLGLKTVAVLYDAADADSRGIAEVFRRIFQAGGQVIAFESFTSGDEDFTRQLERIRDAAPQGLFLPNFSKEVILQGQQIRRLGLDTVLLGSDGWLMPDLARHNDLDGAYFSLSWHRDVSRTSVEAETFVDHYQQAYGREPDELAAVTYDGFGLLFEALANAGRPDSESIQEALSRIDGFPGVTGPITYRGRGGDPKKDAVIVRIEEGEIRLFKVINPQLKE